MGVIENRIDITELERSGVGGGGTAASVSYDNTASHMTATDVQAALDELNLNVVEGLALVNTSVASTRAMIAPAEEVATASAAYAVGDQLIYNNLLYKVTAAIAIGDTITPGTNVTLADEVTGQIFGMDYKILYFTWTWSVPTGSTRKIFALTDTGLARVESLMAAGYTLVELSVSAFTVSDVFVSLVSNRMTTTTKEIDTRILSNAAATLDDIPFRCAVIAFKPTMEQYTITVS